MLCITLGVIRAFSEWRNKIMASVHKKSGSYYVVYSYIDETGKGKQKWEKCSSKGEAYKRKLEVEAAKESNHFVMPKDMTVAQLMDQFVDTYGVTKWGPVTFDHNTALIRNYINPVLGDIQVQQVKKYSIDKFYQQLSVTKPVEVRGKKSKGFLSPSTIEKISHVLNAAFKQAVAWEIIEKSPCEGAIRPKTLKNERPIWTSDLVKQALELCEDNRLYLAMNLSFAASLRLGECLGLTWSCVNITDEEIMNNDCWVYIDKELIRLNKRAIERVGNNGVLQVFPSTKHNATTCMVLKRPKSQTSIRKVWIPNTLALILREWKKKQDELKELIGTAYSDFDLVIAHNDGRPCDGQVIEHAFNDLKRENNLPDVVFHSLRHSSTTYKLELTHGDIKSIQGDTGHATAAMVTEVYSHILDSKRKQNALAFDEAFYKQPDLRGIVEDARVVHNESAVSAMDVIKAVKESPELLNELRSLLLNGDETQGKG